MLTAYDVIQAYYMMLLIYVICEFNKTSFFDISVKIVKKN